MKSNLIVLIVIFSGLGTAGFSIVYAQNTTTNTNTTTTATVPQLEGR